MRVSVVAAVVVVAAAVVVVGGGDSVGVGGVSGRWMVAVDDDVREGRGGGGEAWTV